MFLVGPRFPDGDNHEVMVVRPQEMFGIYAAICKILKF